jgi:hypothetical protein
MNTCGPNHPASRNGSPAVDIFIRSYWKDFEWLRFCLDSVAKYCIGFRAVVVVLPLGSEPWVRKFAIPRDVTIKWCRNYRDDYLGQQVTKLLADTFTDAAHICHVDSDCIFTRTTSPEDLLVDGKIRILHHPYALLGRHHPWREPTEKFLGWRVHDDFMQHPPFMYPRRLYAQAREHALTTHGIDLETYVTRQPARGFSEFNVLGALAWRYHHDQIHWIDTSVTAAGEPHCRWYWSWGGMDDTTRAAILRDLEIPREGRPCP